MKIKCLLAREGGTVVSLGDNSYHFAPDANGDHVAEVDDQDHIDTLLAIEDGYAEADAVAKPAKKAKA